MHGTVVVCSHDVPTHYSRRHDVFRNVDYGVRVPAAIDPRRKSACMRRAWWVLVRVDAVVDHVGLKVPPRVWCGSLYGWTYTHNWVRVMKIYLPAAHLCRKSPQGVSDRGYTMVIGALACGTRAGGSILVSACSGGLTLVPPRPDRRRNQMTRRYHGLK